MKNYLSGGILFCLIFLLTINSYSAFGFDKGARKERKILAANFKINDLDQIGVELSSFRNKNPVVLFFWTTWCPYCRTALKNFNQDLPDLEKKGITVLPINSGESFSKVAEFAKNNDYIFRIFLDNDTAVSDLYHVYGVPTYFLVDKNGYICSVSNTFPRDEAKKLVEEK